MKTFYLDLNQLFKKSCDKNQLPYFAKVMTKPNYHILQKVVIKN